MNKPLDGIRVLDLGQIFMGPYAGFILAGLGAEVIKIEPPGGETIRSRSDDNHPPAYYFYNGGKKDIVLNLKSDEGVDLFKDLVGKSDVIIENFKPGTMESLGLGYETLRKVNPQIIYAHGSGYGDYGPDSDAPAMDLAIQARGGIMETTGFPDSPPVRTGPAVADILGGIHLVTGILGALYKRTETGEGACVDVGMLDCIYPTLASPMTAALRGAEKPHRFGNRHAGGSISPYNAYQSADGYVVIMCVTDKQWEKLAAAMDRAELINDERFVTKVSRAQNVDLIDEYISEWVKDQTREEILSVLSELDVPCAPVQDIQEVTSDTQLLARGMINPVQTHGSDWDEVPAPGNPIQYDGEESRSIPSAPELGEHTDKVLEELAGRTSEEINSYRDADVIF